MKNNILLISFDYVQYTVSIKNIVCKTVKPYKILYFIKEDYCNNKMMEALQP